MRRTQADRNVNKLRVLLLTVLMLLPAAHVLGQYKPSEGLNNTPVVCNDGTIEVNVARAFRGVWSLGDHWVIEGWYSVDPGKCREIGPKQLYQDSNLFGSSNVTLLTFAFRDSTGVWGATRVRDTTDGVFKPSNQKLCVQDGAFGFVRDASKGEDPAARECGRGELAGYYQMPVSLVFNGDSYGDRYGNELTTAHTRDFLHVSLDPNDRAIPSGTQGSSQTPSNAAPPPAANDGNSLGTQVLQALAKAAAESKPPESFDPGTLNAQLFGKKIVRRASGNTNWYYEDGSRLDPLYALDGQSQSYLLDAPTQRRKGDPAVDTALRALQQALTQYQGATISDQGRLTYLYALSTVTSGDHETHFVNIAMLDFARANRVGPFDGGRYGFDIPCKEDRACATGARQDAAGSRQVGEAYIANHLTVYFVGDDNGNAIWSALQKLRDLYPAEPSIVVR
jgi:hypothetical protein